MRRLLVIVPLLLAVSVPVAHATAVRGKTTYWDLSLKGKQTLTWDYEVSTHDCEIRFRGETNKGGGTATIGFASSKSITRVGATRDGQGGALLNLGYVDGPIPATWSKQASASIVSEPCPDDDDADVAPIPTLQKTEGCGTRKTKLGFDLALKKGRLQIGGRIDPVPDGGNGCLSAPGFGYRKEIGTCHALHNPSWSLLAEPMDGGGLVRFLVKLDRERLAARKPKKYLQDGNVGAECKLEGYGTGGGTVKVAIDYTLTFKPWSAKAGRSPHPGR